MKTIPICKKINDKYAEKYFSAVTKRVKCSKEDHDTQRNNNRTILIKVSIIIHHRSKQSGLRLPWIVFYKIAHIYRDITKQETEQASLLIKGFHDNFESTKATGTPPATPNVSIPLQPKMPLDPKNVTTAPEDIE